MFITGGVPITVNKIAVQIMICFSEARAANRCCGYFYVNFFQRYILKKGEPLNENRTALLNGRDKADDGFFAALCE
jgi:hypothetical protein